MNNPFNPFGFPPADDAMMKARIVKLENTIAAHRAALLKANDLLKVCIARIEALEGRK